MAMQSVIRRKALIDLQTQHSPSFDFLLVLGIWIRGKRTLGRMPCSVVGGSRYHVFHAPRRDRRGTQQVSHQGLKTFLLGLC